MDHLEPEELALYRDLVEGMYGYSLRLEQERVRFSVLAEALKERVRRPSVVGHGDPGVKGGGDVTGLHADTTA